jgi:dTDP-4-amino-4,6-dideoxygalactose transaminase
VFLSDYGGDPVDSQTVRKIIGDDCLLLIDAATSFGTKYSKSNQYVHSSADFVCYSFDAMKLLTTGEGGAAVIRDTLLMEKFKEYTYLGLPTKQKSGLDVAKKDSTAGWWEYDLNCFGKRAVMSDLAASLGLAEIDDVDKKLKRKTEIYNKYRLALDQLKDVSILSCDNNRYISSNYFFTILTERRSELARYLLDNEIYTSFRYWPVHKMSLFNNDACSQYENSNFFSSNALNLPIHCGLSDDDIEFITNKISTFYES